MSGDDSEANARDRVSVEAGAMLAGKFRVERIVGRGGMGVVIEATNVQLDQKVALKLLARGADDPATVERFSNEARAAAGLKSEHVARVYDVGKDTLHGPFIVMEMLEGKTLADVVKTGRVAQHRAVEYVIDACEGLAEAHARGIVHQDVKPANLFLVTGADGRPSVKLLDFGIATMRSKERELDTKSSHPSAGTPAYLAPEQLRAAQPIDHRADVWALGCVLYELLVGERPFRATRFTELVTKILETEPHPFPDDLEMPPTLAAVIHRCLQKDVEKRFQSTGELAIALMPFARRRAHAAVSRAVAHVKTGGLAPHLQMPSTVPPAADSNNDIPSTPGLRAPPVPSFDDMPPSQLGRANTIPAPPPAPVAPKKETSSAVRIAIAVVLLGGIGGAIAIGTRSGRTEVTPTGRTPSAVAPVLPTTPSASATLPTASASASPTMPTTSAVASSLPLDAGDAGAVAATERPRPSPAPRPRPTAAATPKNGESDIRLTR